MTFYSPPLAMNNESSNTPNSKRFPFFPLICDLVLIFYPLFFFFPIKDLVFNKQDSLLLSLTVHVT